ncbi:hypothetical protein [Pantoea sp. ACRSC]|uniref:hypothetical protein n=3 Tax=unclassified Pantoea TaxID=2630326 RepID=UPI001EF71C80|nr:hypothetical protein [Pantoea sp. ACRSC]MCG7399126.1 hypothetical protein [Pantoea sp. ACRSC]
MSITNSGVETRQTLLQSLLTSAKLLDVSQMGGADLSTNAARIDAALDELAAALEAAGVAEPLPDGTAKVTDGTAVNVTSGSLSVPASVKVSGTSLSSVALSNETDAVVSDTQAVSIQDRNNVTLLGSGVAARVSRGGLISAYFTGLNYGINSDGNPLDVTTGRGNSTAAGRVRCYVVNNVVKNVYLDGAAMLQNGAAVRVQNASALGVDDNCTAIVANNLLTAVQLPADVSAIRSGKVKVITDAAGHTANATPAVSAGNLTSQTLEGTASLTVNGSSVTIDGQTYTFTVAGGAITAVAVAAAASS